jgi:hypothetical protein
MRGVPGRVHDARFSAIVVRAVDACLLAVTHSERRDKDSGSGETPRAMRGGRIRGRSIYRSGANGTASTVNVTLSQLSGWLSFAFIKRCSATQPDPLVLSLSKDGDWWLQKT